VVRTRIGPGSSAVRCQTALSRRAQIVVRSIRLIDDRAHLVVVPASESS